MKRKTHAKWDPPIPAGFPVGLVMHPAGANRRQRRKSREHKNDPTPPGSMVPHVRRSVMKRVPVAGRLERRLGAPDKGHIEYIEIPTGKVEYVAAW